MTACLQPQLDQETAFPNGLTDAREYHVRGTVSKLIDEGGATAASPDELMELEQQYLAALQAAAAYSIQLEALGLRTEADAIAVMLVR